MKTLSELNSKWYWRLLKVTNYVVIATVMLLCIFIYNVFLSYDPKIFKEFEQNTKEALNSIEKLK